MIHAAFPAVVAAFRAVVASISSNRYETIEHRSYKKWRLLYEQ